VTITVKLPAAALTGLKHGAKESVTFTLSATNTNGTGTAKATVSRLHAA
jgi:hypothetical protein